MITPQQYIKIDLKQLTQKLTDLNKRAEELDMVLQDVRVEINNMLWGIN